MVDMKFLDREKARRLLEEELGTESVERADLVLSGDEFWNTETIYKNDGFYTQDDFKCYFASSWSTPMLVIYYKDGKQKRTPCFFLESEDEERASKAWKRAEAERAINNKRLQESLEEAKVKQAVTKRKSVIKKLAKL